jgi:hypothetical protein
VDSVRIPAFSDQARQVLSQYIARSPLPLKKIGIEENGDATAVSFTSQREFFKGKTDTLPVIRFFLSSPKIVLHNTGHPYLLSLLLGLARSLQSTIFINCDKTMNLEKFLKKVFLAIFRDVVICDHSSYTTVFFNYWRQIELL